MHTYIRKLFLVSKVASILNDFEQILNEIEKCKIFFSIDKILFSPHSLKDLLFTLT